MMITWGRKFAAIATPLVAVGSLYTVWPSSGETPSSADATRVTQALGVTAQQAGTTRVTQAEGVTATQSGTTRVTQTHGVTATQSGTTRVTQTFAFLLLDVQPPTRACPFDASYVLVMPCVHAASVSTITLDAEYQTTLNPDAHVASTTLRASYAPTLTCIHAMFGDKC